MAKKVEKKTKRAVVKAAEPVKKTVTKVKATPKKIEIPVEAPKKEMKPKAKKVKALVRGKVVKAEVKGLKKHKIKKTGEVIRFKQSRHPENKDAHLVHVHGKPVDDGLQLVTPAAQSSISASLRARDTIAPGSQFTFATARDF